MKHVMADVDRVVLYRQVRQLLEEERTKLNVAISAIDQLIPSEPEYRVARPAGPARRPPKRGASVRPSTGAFKESIIELLETQAGPITTAAIAKVLKGRGFPSTSYASVYNTLKRIAQTGAGVVKSGNAWQLSPAQAQPGHQH